MVRTDKSGLAGEKVETRPIGVFPEAWHELMPEAAPGGEALAKGRVALAWERLQELWYLVDVHTATGGDVSTKQTLSPKAYADAH